MQFFGAKKRVCVPRGFKKRRKSEKIAKNTLKIEKSLKKVLTNEFNVLYLASTKNSDIIERNSTMSTTMLRKEDVERKWYVIDAADKPLGKVAVLAATILNGKHRPEYTPHVDCGECVIVINASKVILTGKKLDQKYYYRHSGYVGGLKATKYRTLMATKPEMAMELAVKGMLPKNKIGDASFGRLKVYAGAEHKQSAQTPIAVEVK